MKERLSQMIDYANDMWICTFHSMCSRILRRDIDKLGYTSNFSIYTDVEKTRTVKRILESKNTNITADTIMWHISNAKNHLLSPSDYSSYISDSRKSQIITACYLEYEEELKRCNALDFDDLLNKTYELFTSNSEVLEYYQNKFRYIHVDEFQDTNTSQYELVKLLAKKHNNVFAVGDEDQCIYSWRGADVTNVQAFTKDFKNVQIFKLEQNYRSTKKILETANSLIKHNQARIEKKLWTNNDDGTKVEYKTTYNETEEAEYVASTIKNLVDYYGYKYSDFAVLMRVNSLSRVVEEKFLTYGIAYKLYGGFKFFERKEIKDIIAYLRLMHNEKDDEATRRMLSFPKKGIGDSTISQILVTALDNNVSMYQAIMQGLVIGKANKKLEDVKQTMQHLKEKSEQMPLYEFVEYLIEYVDFKGALAGKTEEDTNKQMNVDDFLLSVKQYSEDNTTATLEDYLQSITLLRDIDSLDQSEDFASIITVHAAKGLEFKVVFIIGLNDGLFPLSRAINSSDMNDLEEERRLMYVAITRAKERLYLSRAKTRFSFETKRTEYTIESRFLRETNIAVNNVSSYSDSNYNKFGSTKINIDVSSDSIGKDHSVKVKPTKDYSLYKRGTRVKHPHFGEGVVTLEVTDFSAGFVTVKFDTVGIKTLSLKYADLQII